MGALLIAAVALQQRLGGAAVAAAAAAASWPANLAGHDCAVGDGSIARCRPSLAACHARPAAQSAGFAVASRRHCAGLLYAPFRFRSRSQTYSRAWQRSIAKVPLTRARCLSHWHGARCPAPLCRLERHQQLISSTAKWNHGAARECPPLSRVPHALQAAVAGCNPLHEALLADDDAGEALRGPTPPRPRAAVPPSGAGAAAALPPGAGAWECVVSHSWATSLACHLKRWASRPVLRARLEAR